jgi:predicted metal-dependent HD superfamily phosphohydrolase
MSSFIPSSEAILDKGRFDALWKRCSSLDGAANTTHVWGNLIKRYSEQHRHYHNARHLVFCLHQLDLAASYIENTDAIEMAIWFHDLVFEPRAKDNEERSAALFKIAANACFPPSFVDTVSEIIVATKHIDNPNHNNEAYMVDIDLSSIALRWTHFCQDCSDLRAELSGISDTHFYSKKLAFFEALLKRPSIYFTEYFFTRYEDKAKQNILRYIPWLQAQGYE